MRGTKNILSLVYLKTRINEHYCHIYRNTQQHSVITDHGQLSHEFNWIEIDILDDKSNLGKRLISEMIYIKRQKNSLNLHNDIDQFGKRYLPIIT